MQQAPSVRKALYVLFARLLADAPDADLYARLHSGPLSDLARIQGVDLWSDLMVETDATASAAELKSEYVRLSGRVSLRATDYASGTQDPVAAIGGFLREHPQYRGNLVDILIGDVFKPGVGEIFDAMGKVVPPGDDLVASNRI